MKRILIKDGQVVQNGKTMNLDVLIEGEKIAKIGKNIEIDKDAETINAKDMYVLPGLIEPHMHIKAPLGGITDILDFDSASKCAAFGGITTFMDFSSTLPKDPLWEAVDNRLKEMEGKAVQDYSVHCKVVNLATKESLANLMQSEVNLDKAKVKFDNCNPKLEADYNEYDKAIKQLAKAKDIVDKEVQAKLDEIPKIIESGIPTFKLFMTYRKANVMIDDIYLLKVLKTVRDNGGRCGFHAECNAIAEYNDMEFIKAGKTKWSDFPESKPAICEEEAVRRVLYYAELLKAPIYFFHISTKGAVQAIREAKARNVDVIAETCSHYLTLTKEKNIGDDGILYLMSPPLRSKEDQDALWEGIDDGTIDLVTSDNCTFPRKMKEASLKKGSDEKIIQDYTKVISGVSGIEERLGLMLSKVKDNTITIEKLVDLLCHNPAKYFGCSTTKGYIQTGFDADITIVDPNASFKFTLDNLHYPKSPTGDNGLEYSVYQDFTSGGSVIHTIRRGEFLVKDGKYQGEDGVSPVGFGKRIARVLPVKVVK